MLIYIQVLLSIAILIFLVVLIWSYIERSIDETKADSGSEAFLFLLIIAFVIGLIFSFKI